VEHLPDCTIAVTGGEEDKIGVKNYDELDEIFSLIEELNNI
jgi:hypothetical protein